MRATDNKQSAVDTTILGAACECDTIFQILTCH